MNFHCPFCGRKMINIKEQEHHDQLNDSFYFECLEENTDNGCGYGWYVSFNKIDQQWVLQQ